MVRGLTLRQLQVLRLMLETGSTTETGRLLRISQPAVSKLLQQIQEQFRLRLFAREHGRLVPTQEARLLAPDLITALGAVDGVLRRMDSLQETDGALVRIAATSTLANTLVPAAMQRFLRRHPATEVKLHTALNEDVIDSVLDQQAELGFVLAPANDAAATACDLAAADLVCVMPKGHGLSKHEQVTPAQLLGQSLISYSARQPIGALMDAAFEQCGVRRVVAVEVTQSATGCALVAAGIGVAVVDGYVLLGGALPNIVVRPFRPKVRITARLLQPQGRLLSPAAAAFVRETRRVVQESIAAGKLHAVP